MITHNCIRSIDSISDNVLIWGGKAVSLFRLHNAGFLIPKGLVIPTYYFRQFLNRTIDIPSFSEIIQLKCKSFFGDRDINYVIRSSATVEGNPTLPYCGVFESYIYDGSFSLMDLIIKVWESARSPLSFDYTKDEAAFNSIEMAVIIQEIVSGDYSAVIQSSDIIDNTDRIILEYNNSSIDSIVNGLENSYLAYIYPAKGFIEYLNPNCPSIHPHIINSIIKDCKRGESVFGTHVEYEVLIKGNTIIYVQARRSI